MVKECKTKVCWPILPWHHGFRSGGSSEQQLDWNDFEEMRQVQAIDRMVSVLSSSFMMYFSAALFVKDLFLGLDLLQHTVSSGFLLCCIVRAAGPFCRRSVRNHPLQAGVTIQVILFLYLNVILAIMAISMEDQLMKHRYFLSGQSFGLVGIFTLGSIPAWVYLWVAGPINFMIWLAFHLYVDFWRVPAMITGAIVCFTPAGLDSWIENIQWQQFRIHRQLDRERQVLEETQNALHRLLSSQWDASCTVDSDGTISSSSPHLNQLIAAGSDIKGLKLSLFAADRTDTARLNAFLKRALTAEDNRALSLNCSFQPQSDVAEEITPIEIVLYGVRLPGGDMFKGGQVFIGIKGTKEPEVLVSSADTLAFGANTLPMNDRFDTISVTQGTLQGTKDASHCTGNDSCISLGTLDYTMSESTGFVPSIEAAREQQALCRSCDIATQTDDSLRLTDQTVSKTVGVQTCSLPPCPPLAHLRGGQRSAKFTSKPRKLLKEFKSTKEATLVYLLEQVKLRVNVRGYGCCRWHIAGQAIHKQLKEQAASPCREHFLPYHHLQCAECLAMNEADEDACGVCCRPFHENARDANQSQVLPQDAKAQASSPSQERNQLGSFWQCKLCFTMSSTASDKCSVCHSTRKQTDDEHLADGPHRSDDDVIDASLQEQWLRFM